jgi:nitronate monooxygenase
MAPDSRVFIMFATRLTSLLGIELPIIQGPIGPTADPTLATAVCKAGALGTLAARAANPDELRTEIQQVRKHTSHPFGVGFITHLLGPKPRHFEVALEERVPVVLLSFGDPSPLIPIARSSGAKVICQVQSFDLARRAVDAGADVICVQGNEAGGHTGRENLLPFLIQAVTAFPYAPILASGGITCDRSLAAVLAAGAEGAWLGTAFLACKEAVKAKPATREAVLASNGRDTVFSPATDYVIYQGQSKPGWPAGVAARQRRNEITEQWKGREEELLKDRAALDAYYQRMSNGDPAVANLFYGQGAGAISELKSAHDIVNDMVSGAVKRLRGIGA